MKGDYPIKVLEIAPLIKVTLPAVSSFFSTCGLPPNGMRDSALLQVCAMVMKIS
jgi:hypothetical protein